MQTNITKYRSVIILFLFMILYSCEKEPENSLPDPVYFVESEFLAAYNTGQITELVNNTGNASPMIEMLIHYDVEVYRIIYNTVDTDNNLVLASGAMVVPDNKSPLPLVSFQHGTITKEEDAPSSFSANQYYSALLYASAGFILVLPDYLGYGSSGQLEHPYEHGNSIATASRDMLRAAREFDLIKDEFRANDKIFLSGYSEGGYATMALLKLLEEEHSDEFQLTAATAGAGAYNKSEFARHIVESDITMTYLNSFLWVLDTYNKVYKINRPYSYFFNAPYSAVIETGGVFANTELNPRNLLTNNFREGIINKTDTIFINALADNDNFDWKPTTPLQLYHGTADDYVFYFNSATAFEAMTDKGAESVEFIIIQGGDHYTTVPAYFTGTYLFFSKFLN